MSKKTMMLMLTIVLLVSFFTITKGMPYANENAKNYTHTLTSGTFVERDYLPKECDFEYFSNPEEREYSYNSYTVLESKRGSELLFKLDDISNIPEKILVKEITVSITYGKHQKLKPSILFFLGRANRNYALDPKTYTLYQGKFKDFKEASYTFNESGKQYAKITLEIQNANSQDFSFREMSYSVSLAGKFRETSLMKKTEGIVWLITFFIAIIGFFVLLKAKNENEIVLGKRIMIVALLIPVTVIISIFACDIIFKILIEGAGVAVMSFIYALILLAASLVAFR